MIAQQPIDVRTALAHAIAAGQMQQMPNAPIPHHVQVTQMQQIAQALAKQIANQRQAPGKASVYGHPPIDGGYSGAGIHDAAGHLVARAGFGPHPVPPQILPEGFFPPPRVPGGVNYGQ